MRALAVLALALLGAQDSKFKFDSWEAWNSFKEGSMIEFEMDSSSFKMTAVKFEVKK